VPQTHALTLLAPQYWCCQLPSQQACYPPASLAVTSSPAAPCRCNASAAAGQHRPYRPPSSYLRCRPPLLLYPHDPPVLLYPHCPPLLISIHCHSQWQPPGLRILRHVSGADRLGQLGQLGSQLLTIKASHGSKTQCRCPEYQAVIHLEGDSLVHFRSGIQGRGHGHSLFAKLVRYVCGPCRS
jgi:hypothetical protein